MNLDLTHKIYSIILMSYNENNNIILNDEIVETQPIKKKTIQTNRPII